MKIKIKNKYFNFTFECTIFGTIQNDMFNILGKNIVRNSNYI